MRHTIAIIALAVTITNADLGKPLVWRAPPPSPATWAGLLSRQWVPPPENPPVWEPAPPRWTNNPAGPWEWPEPTQARRLDGTYLSDPVQVYGTTWPIYGPRHTHRAGRRSR
jgi:hypothetical protein